MNTLLYDNEEDTDRRSGTTRLKERPMLIVRVSDDDQLRRIYDFGDELGRGRYGVVLHARARLTRMCWAIKVINKSQAKYPGMKLVDREIKILRLITHPNIIHLEKVYESPKKLYLVFELCSSTLAQEFSERRPFSEGDTREVIRKLASAVAYLHRNGIVHRDLKLENILLTTNPADTADKLYIKVTDFGQSVVRSGVAHDQMLGERCGTMAYMAPEVLESRMYSHQCDVWSMGVIMFVLLVGDFPFTGENPEQLKLRVLNDDPQFETRHSSSASSSTGSTVIMRPIHISDDAKAVVHSMLTKKPEFRITAAELCVHPWLLDDPCSVTRMNVLELMNSMMETDGTDDERRISRTSTRDSTMLAAAPSTSIHHSEEDVARRNIRPVDSDTHQRSKNPGVTSSSGMLHSDADNPSRRQSLRSRKEARPRPPRHELHLPPPPPPHAAAPVLAVIDGRHQAMGRIEHPYFVPGIADRRTSDERRRK